MKPRNSGYVRRSLVSARMLHHTLPLSASLTLVALPDVASCPFPCTCQVYALWLPVSVWPHDGPFHSRWLHGCATACSGLESTVRVRCVAGLYGFSAAAILAPSASLPLPLRVPRGARWTDLYAPTGARRFGTMTFVVATTAVAARSVRRSSSRCLRAAGNAPARVASVAAAVGMLTVVVATPSG